MAAMRLQWVRGLPRGCAVNEASTLIETGSLTLNSFCAEMRKESDILTVPQVSHDLNPILVFNYLYFLIKIEKKGEGAKRQQKVYCADTETLNSSQS